MATFDELQAYYEILNEAFLKDKESYHFNHDRSHNATVMRFMFDKSSEINMYCGKLSVLRESFYEHIAEDSEIIKEAVIESFKSYLERRDSKFSIIFEDYSNDIFTNLICKDVFMRKVKEGQIKLYQLNKDFSFKEDINHFCYTNTRITRFEEDKTQHSAICIFHNEEYYSIMEKHFNILLNIAKEIN